MLSERFLKIKDPQTVFNAVMNTHTYYENGLEKIDITGEKILSEWSKINGMSFRNPKYLREWREKMREKIGMPIFFRNQFDETVLCSPVHKKKKIDRKKADFHVAHFPKVKNYADYLREWNAQRKKMWRPIEEIRARMARDKAERGLKNL